MHLTRFRHDQKGQTAAEFALVLPVFCVLLFGVIQFGITFNNYLALTDAVRTGARKAAVSRQEAAPSDVVKESVRKAAVNLDTSADKLVITVSPGTPWTHGQDVTVAATYPYEISLLGLVVKSGRLESKTTERVE
jgi:Flp pilus assembly protein TadG